MDLFLLLQNVIINFDFELIDWKSVAGLYWSKMSKFCPIITPGSEFTINFLTFFI